jgi:hypothetical protein
MDRRSGRAGAREKDREKIAVPYFHWPFFEREKRKGQRKTDVYFFLVNFPFPVGLGREGKIRGDKK